MAKRTQTILVDDLDGSQADETITFGLDGDSYEIDLTAENALALRELLAPYLEAATKTTGKRPRKRATKPATSTGSTPSALIRAWAAEQGLAVNSRGRIPADIVAAYDAAHA